MGFWKTRARAALALGLASAPLAASGALAAQPEKAPASAPPATPAPAKPGLCMLYLDALVGGGGDAKAASLARGVYDKARDLTTTVYREQACTGLVDGTLVLVPGTTFNITDAVRQRLDAAPAPTPPAAPPPAGPPSFRALFAPLHVIQGGDAALDKACGLDGVVILQRSKTVTYIDERIAALKAQANAEVAATGPAIQAEADALLNGQGKMSAAQVAARSADLRERMKAQRALMNARQSQVRALESAAFGRFQAQLGDVVEAQIAAHRCDLLVDLKALGPFPAERDLTAPVLAALDAQFVAFPIAFPVDMPAPDAAGPHS